MRILFISSMDILIDSRSRELLSVLETLGEVYSVYMCKTYQHSTLRNIQVNKNKRLSFYKLILHSISIAKKIKPNIIFSDNRLSIIPAFLSNKLSKSQLLINDSRELYTFKEMVHLKGKMGCVVEKIFLKRFDMLICANSQRAKFMKDYFKLNKIPIVYENMSQLEYNNNNNLSRIQNEIDKYKAYIKIVSSSGLSFERMADKLINDFSLVHLEKVVLFVAGTGDNDEITKINKLIGSLRLEEKVILLGNLNRSELKYVIQNSHIGIVTYNTKDINNRYCASGKIYEYLFEGLPIATTENEPLVELCEKHGVGIASDNLSESIITIIENFNKYQENVKNFVHTISIDKNNNMLSEVIRNELIKRMNNVN